MKKTLSLITALLLAAAFTGCGKSSNDKSSSAPTSNSSESSNAEKSDKKEKVVVDAFDKVAYGVPKEDYFGNRNVYPEKFTIEMNASESPFGEHMTFTYFIESADENEIIIKARANIDEIQDFLNEYNYTVEETEKTFSIKVADLTTNLISSDLISGENKTKIINTMQDYIESELKMSEDDEYEDPLAALGISSNNPDYKKQEEENKEAFEKEKTESLQKEFTLEKLYTVMPSTIQYNMEKRKADSTITSVSDENSFEDKEIYSNKANLEITSNIVNSNCNVLGVFKDTSDKYYCVRITGMSDHILFDKGVINLDNVKFMLSKIYDSSSGGILDTFDDEKAAYEAGIKSLDDMADISEYEIVEISLS